MTTQFKKGSDRAREAGRKGGLVRAAQRRQAKGPYEGTIIDMMETAELTGPSWVPWRAFLKAVFALPMTEEEGSLYRSHTERGDAPAEQVDEAWMPVGRRGGKSRIAALVAFYLAIRFDHTRLAPGELAVVPVIAADRRQARAVLGYIRGFAALPEFSPWVERELKESIEIRSGVNIETFTASYRTTRGPTVIGCVCDEVAFWRTDDSAANPDSEVLSALRPGMATVEGSLLLGLSSPYAARGELYTAHERFFGTDDPHTLVWNADTRSMNPSVPERIVVRAFEEDPVSASSEFGTDGRVTFRRDVEVFLDRDAVDAVTPVGCRELPPAVGIEYTAFVDPSGGSQDSFTLAIAHADEAGAVLDVVREVRPPFSPNDVVRDYAKLLRAYRVFEVTGDRYAGEWPRERFEVHGVRYVPSDLTKSDIYREFVAPVNAATVQLLDLPTLRAQLLGLERRVARSGRDSIDHAPGGRDDVANAAAGALVAVGRNVGHAWSAVSLAWL